MLIRLSLRSAIAAFIASLTLSAQDAAIPEWTLAGRNTASYIWALDRTVFHSGKASATLRCKDKSCAQFAAIQQAVKSDDYVGKRVRLSGWIKGNKTGHARLWMRILGPTSEVVNFSDVSRFGKAGTFDWQRQQIVLDVAPPGVLIYFGMILEGHGQAWLDDVSLEIVPNTVKENNMVKEPYRTTSNSASREREYAIAPSHPVNLDFEQPPLL
jgi:hypothetical protein